jgi:chloramphenicol-sensitive protein RarD
MSDDQQTKGLVQVVSGYLIWGLLPIFWKTLTHVHSLEVILHRILWGAICAVLYFLIQRRSPVGILRSVWSADRKYLLILSAATVTANWLSYVYAVTSGQILQASLGYYISPIMLVSLGVFFKEPMNKLQKAALVLAGIGVLYSALRVGTIPWLSLLIAGTFAGYAMIKKRMGADGMKALLSDTVILFPFALGVVIYLFASRQGVFLQPEAPSGSNLLLMLAGPATLLPLGLFIQGAITIPYKTIGFMQFITPTMTFLLGTIVYGERFSLDEFITFMFIIAGVLCYVLSLMQSRHHAKMQNKKG